LDVRAVAGRVLYGALFVVVLPLCLYAWVAALDRSVQWPVPHWPAFAFAVIAGGTTLMLTAMVQLYVQGRGLPMSAFPPTDFVTGGAYGLVRHPMYLGAALLCFGSALLSGSSGGLYVVTPVFIAAMAAYVYGYENPRLAERFGAALREYHPLLSLPPATFLPVSWPRKAAVTLAVVVPWLLVGYLIDYARQTPAHPGAFVALFDAPSLRSWPLPYWTIPFLALALLALTSVTDEDLRSAAVAGFTAMCVGSYLYAVLPGLGLDLRSGGWQLGATNLIVCVAALSYRRVWEALRGLCERVANSRRDRLLFGGRFRIINHAVYSGLAGAVGAAVGGAVLGNGVAALTLAVFMLVGAAVLAQLLWGNTALLRPFGYWGAVLGAAAGVVVVHLAFGIPLVTLALACALGAPFAQAIGRFRCLAQGCCHGVETRPTLGIRVWQHQSRVVALSGLKGRFILITQLYSVIFNIALGLVLLSLYRSGGVDSTVILGLYLLLTGIERFAEDAYRGEKQTRWTGPLRENQWIAIAALVLGMVIAVVPSAPPTAPDGVVRPSLIVAAVLAGLVAAFATSMDFPTATLRFSRLSG
jgi:protein-S-isoprenylcysteine O-methyltransferase Ste14